MPAPPGAAAIEAAAADAGTANTFEDDWDAGEAADGSVLGGDLGPMDSADASE